MSVPVHHGDSYAAFEAPAGVDGQLHWCEPVMLDQVGYPGVPQVVRPDPQPLFNDLIQTPPGDAEYRL